MLSKRFIIFSGAILLVGIVMMFVTYRGLRTVEEMTLDKYGDYLKSKYQKVEHISVNELAALIKLDELEADRTSLLIVDCRSLEEFQVSHLEGAVHLETTSGLVEYLAGQESPYSNIAIYSAVGLRSAKLISELKKSEIDPTPQNVVGSIFKWGEEGRPLVDGSGNPTTEVHPFDDFWERLKSKP